MHLPILLSSCQLASDLISARLRSSCRARLASLAVAVLAAGMACQAAATSEGSPADTISTSIYFPSGSASLKPDFMHNGMRLDEFIHRISALEADSAAITAVDITAYSSPEGSLEFNRELSRRRADRIADFLRHNIPSLPGDVLAVRPKGINWHTLALMVDTSAMKYRDEVLDILNNVPEQTYSDGKLVDSRLKRLKDLRGGQPYRYMYRHFFPALRNADISLVCRVERPGQQVNTIVETVVETTETVETVETTTETTTVETSTVTSDTGSDRKPFYMSLSTNMLYDALLVPNIGAEFYLGKNLSVTANWMYGWWSKNSRHRYWRIYGGDLAVRYWFGKAAKEKPLTGHHAGVYGTIFTYDFEFGGRGQMGGKPGGSLWERAQYAAGIEYGYSLPIARRLNLDFTLGVGYMGGTYYDYRPIDGHYMWQKTVRRHWFGPTKLEVSLVWLIGHGNANKSKGGGR